MYLTEEEKLILIFYREFYEKDYEPFILENEYSNEINC